VRLSLFDLQGREVDVLLDADRDVGRHVAAIDAGRLPAGVYFLRLRAAGAELQRRMALFP
jgi:hypothetical protein